MRQTSFFSHDSNATNDPKILVLLAELGLEGYGIYWTVIEHLREQPNYISKLDVLKGLAMRFGSSREKYNAVVLKYQLFQIKDEVFFWSDSLFNRMIHYDSIIAKRQQAGKASGKARQLIAKQLSIESNICSTIKLNESKEKKTIVELVDLAKRVFDYLFEVKSNSLPSSRKFLLTESRRRLIKKRLADGHAFAQFKAVIDYKVAEWVNTDLQKFLIPETLFSDKFDKYLDQARDAYTNGKELDPYRK